MLTEDARTELEKQAYRVIGSHSAVKTCGWTKKMVRNEGGCYKLKFYGIMSHQCMQMTTSISCANRCTFCWRGYKAPVAKEWTWDVDAPEMILKGSKKAHHDLLSGFGGNKKASTRAVKEAKTIKHVALSLTGEPIIYPKMNELIKLFNKEGISTFLVTNAQYPEQIKNLNPVTQLYISLDAPTKSLLKTVDVPLFKDYWERLNLSLDYLREKKQRTCIRLTLIKDINMKFLPEYAEMIHKGDPDFIEIKAYMFVGASRQRLKLENMPLHEEIIAFTKKLATHLPDYAIVSEHIPSRVVMLAKKKFYIKNKWHTWIDFHKYEELAIKGDDFETVDYCKIAPSTGISGKASDAYIRLKVKNPVRVDEIDEELTFWKEDEANV